MVIRYRCPHRFPERAKRVPTAPVTDVHIDFPERVEARPTIEFGAIADRCQPLKKTTT
jgi:hypothetical protein